MTMKKPLPLLSCIATAAACLFVLNNARAQSMSSSDFSAAKSRIQSDYKTDKAACGSRAGNAKDICIAEAKGKEEVAEEKCDALASSAKNSCMAAAKAKFGKL
jgi:hypothetical protein